MGMARYDKEFLNAPTKFLNPCILCQNSDFETNSCFFSLCFYTAVKNCFYTAKYNELYRSSFIVFLSKFQSTIPQVNSSLFNDFKI